MMTSRRLISGALAASAFALLPAIATAQDDGKPAASAPAEAVEAQVRTQDLTGTFGGQRMSYRATVSDTVLKADDGTPEAVIVTTSYVKSPRDTSRPVFFIYNGL